MSNQMLLATAEVGETQALRVKEALQGATALTPVTGRVLASRTGLRGSVSVRRAVNVLRQAGVPVCSNSDGYWLSDSKVEVMACVRELEGRIMGIQAAIIGLRKWAGDTVFEWEKL